jgi:integrase
MPSHRQLTDSVVKRLSAKKGQQVDHFDRQFPGLYLRVSHNRKVWGYVFRQYGRQRRIKFDTYPALSVADAHDRWRRARDDARAGRDPAPKLTPSAPIPSTSFESVFEQWMAKDQAKNRTSAIQRKSIMKDAMPFLYGRDIGSIGRRDILDILDRMEERGHPIGARRMHARLHRLFVWAIGRGIIAVNPVSGAPKPGTETIRERALNDQELLKVWNAAGELRAYGNVVRMLILTGLRRDEIGSLRWDELDLEAGVITIPGSRTKNGEPHLIPLSAPALAILAGVPRNGDFVFGRMSGWSRRKAMLDELAPIAPWRLHDLRRTLATGLQKLKVPLVVTESVLGHTAGSRGGIVKVYQQHDYLDEKRAALESWGAHVMAVIHGDVRGNVVLFRG